jgi:hypothetical protein
VFAESGVVDGNLVFLSYQFRHHNGGREGVSGGRRFDVTYLSLGRRAVEGYLGVCRESEAAADICLSCTCCREGESEGGGKGNRMS